MTFLQKKVIGLRLRTWLLLLLVVPFLLWGILNLLFSTGFGTGFLERKIEGKLGLPCRIERVTWSPWAGVNIEGFEIHALGDFSETSRLLQVGQIQVDPSWTSLFKGRKRVERVEIVDLVGALSIEQLKGMISRYHENHPVMVVSESQGQKSTLAEEVPPSGNSPQVPDHRTKPQGEPSVTPKGKSRERVVADVVPVDDFEGTVILRNASFHLYSEKRPGLDFNIGEVAAEIPIWGGEREGELRVSGFEFGGQFVDLTKNFPIKWDGSSIQLEKSQMKFFGVNFEIMGELRMVAGFPLGLQVNLPSQDMNLSPIYSDRGSPIEVAHISSRNVFQCYLLNPSSLSGRSVTTFTDLILHDPKDGGDTRFNRGSAVMMLTSAGLVAKDVRAIGDDDSILVNGFVTSGGEAAATVRIVSSPERASSHEKRISITSPSLALDFTPLVTPDREYRDIRIETRSGVLAMDLGRDGGFVSFFPTVRAILGNPPIPKLRLP